MHTRIRPQFAGNGHSNGHRGTAHDDRGTAHDDPGTDHDDPGTPGDDQSAPWPWDHLRQRCLRETSRILRRREDAEEAAQEALLRAWRMRHRCRDPDLRTAWVAQIARNEALRMCARRRRQPMPTEIPIRGSTDAHECWRGEREMLDRVAWQDTLGHLVPEDRALVVLCYAGDITQASLANALGIPEATVRVRLHRIRNRLGQVMRSGI
ncbi:MAG TPA: RNA polymerase sigma factor [Solirubrobacteraceae bacterium]|jgi:RNA polymerase sigma-70 factor (ECF subfamily)|nr:RNA polymerase sigma factor [Solirubrobacteraceae bacterium]